MCWQAPPQPCMYKRCCFLAKACMATMPQCQIQCPRPQAHPAKDPGGHSFQHATACVALVHRLQPGQPERKVHTHPGLLTLTLRASPAAAACPGSSARSCRPVCAAARNLILQGSAEGSKSQLEIEDSVCSLRRLLMCKADPPLQNRKWCAVLDRVEQRHVSSRSRAPAQGYQVHARASC